MNNDTNVKIDSKDRAIIKLLQNEPKITHQMVADKLAMNNIKLSRQSIQKRIKHLEKNHSIHFDRTR